MSELCSCKLLDYFMSGPGKLTLSIEVDCNPEAEVEVTPEVVTAPANPEPALEETMTAIVEPEPAAA